MSSEWPVVPLAEVVKLRRGHDLPTQTRITGTVPVIGSGGVCGNHRESVSEGPGVVLGRAANLGRPHWAEGAYWPLNTTLYVTDFMNNEPRFVYHLFQALDVTGYNSGSVQPMLNRNYISQVPVHLPPVEEQRRIAGVLGALDDLIATCEALNGQLRELALARVQQAQSDGASDLSLADVCVFENRKRVPLSASQRREVPGDYPYYGAAAQMDSVGEYLFDQPRVLVGEDGTVTTTSGSPVVQYVWGRYWVNNHAHVLAGTSISTELLRVLVTNADVRDRVTGAVQPKLNMGNLKSLRLRVPSDPDVDQFVQILTAFERELLEETRQLQRTRNELLPLLMSGRVRVKAEDRAAAESAIRERTRIGGD